MLIIITTIVFIIITIIAIIIIIITIITILLLLLLLLPLGYCYCQARQTRPNSGGVAEGHPRFGKGGVAIFFYFLLVKNRTF